jgi:Golgi nucleoside diphosphatase
MGIEVDTKIANLIFIYRVNILPSQHEAYGDILKILSKLPILKSKFYSNLKINPNKLYTSFHTPLVWYIYRNTRGNIYSLQSLLWFTLQKYFVLCLK